MQPALATHRVAVDLINPQTGAKFSVSVRTYQGLKLPASRVTQELLEGEGLDQLPISCAVGTGPRDVDENNRESRGCV